MKSRYMSSPNIAGTHLSHAQGQIRTLPYMKQVQDIVDQQIDEACAGFDAECERRDQCIPA